MTKYLILFFLFPLLLWAKVAVEEPLPLIKSEEKQIQVPAQNISDELKAEKEEEKEKTLSDEAKQILIQNQLIEETIKNINNKSFLVNLPKNETYTKELTLLANKININTKAHNTLAVARDKIEVLLIKDKRVYENTLKQIIIAKEEYREKDYFVTLLQNSIKKIDNNALDKYKPLYKIESANTQPRDNTNSISKDFIKNYIDLYNQKYTQIFILQYLLENIPKFRQTNFLIDEFNLQYFVKKIDSMENISFISNVTRYHLKFSIGEIVMVILIIGFFRLLNLRFISFLISFISEYFIKNKNDEDKDEIHKYLKKSVTLPLVYALYVFSIQLSMYILIQNPILLEHIMPWINTFYVALFSWGFYKILVNSINMHAHVLLVKYHNLRKEMIVFILKILKIVLVLLVLLFLLTQLNIDIQAIVASLGIGGIAIALASKDTLTNFFGSLSIMADNSFSQGDWIQVNDIEGHVVDIRMRTTRIRTFENAMITVPNTILANSYIQNWSKRKVGRRIKMALGITYESRMEDIINLRKDIYEMLENHPGIAIVDHNDVSENKRFEATKREDVQGVKRTLLVYIDEFGASSVNILIYCFAKSPVWEKWLETKEDVLIKIADLVKKNNCDFAYPTQALWLKSEMKKDLLA
ncbi:mechanosensitive ion channel family protein [Sulfurospirillum arcachonense]|uniref:mechanosensitive ion channel family protein n=1 Tax=Sulfurospirillum arcachonense TaxID=57666 RepID=UPI00046984E7|nr:mechanosensitive ion channel family protein [Sulfurospirillum arcachonense]